MKDMSVQPYGCVSGGPNDMDCIAAMVGQSWITSFCFVVRRLMARASEITVAWQAKVASSRMQDGERLSAVKAVISELQGL